jgi:type I restriction enzyme S subunit
MTPLGEILTERKELPSAYDIENGNIRIVAKIGFNDGKIILRSECQTKTNMILIRPGALVVSGINAAKGAIAVYGEENTDPIAATIHYGAYIPNKDRVDIKYLWRLLRSHTFRDLLMEYVPGGIKTELKAKRLLPIPIPLPPLSEQRRIVMRIEGLAAKIEEALRLRQQAVEETESLVVAEYGKIFAKLKLSNRLPLNKIATEVGQQVQAGQMEYFDYPYLSLENIESHTGRILKFRTCQEAEIRGTAVLFGTDDVLYSKLRPYLNKVTTPSFEGCATTELVVFKPDTTIVDRNYFAAFLRDTQVVKEAIANSVGTKMPRTNMRWFRQLLVPVPTLKEQRHIVAYLDNLQAKMDAVKRLQSETVTELDALLPSILDKAFKGAL